MHYGVWIRICEVRLPDAVNSFLHNSHLNDLAPLWVIICEDQCSDSLKLKSFPHNSHHLNGFDPVSMISNMSSQVPEHVNSFSHKSHLYGFDPV